MYIFEWRGLIEMQKSLSQYVENGVGWAWEGYELFFIVVGD